LSDGRIESTGELKMTHVERQEGMQEHSLQRCRLWSDGGRFRDNGGQVCDRASSGRPWSAAALRAAAHPDFLPSLR
jgi:hypothetical protein